MKNIKHYGKRWLAMVLSLIMCFGLLQTTSFAANEKSGDTITINVRVYDQGTGVIYKVGTDSVSKGNPELIQSVHYQIPQLTRFVSASQFGRVTKVAGNWYFPAGDSQPGANVEWSCNANSVTMTYWVNWYKTGSGSGSGSNQDTTVNIGSSGSKIWTQYITYHSNYPDGTSYSYKVTYNIQSYTAMYNDWNCIKSLSDVKFSTPNGYEAKSPIWNTNKAGTGTGYAPGSQYTFQQANNGKNLDLYAQWQSTGGTVVTPVTLTYMDGSEVYGTRNYFAGDTATAILCTTEKSGYTFAGWAESAGSQTVKYRAGIEFTINSNMTLYAVWEKDSSGPEATECITVNKVFSGLTIDEFPWDFSIEYTAVNTKEPEYSTTETLTMTNAEDFDETTMTVTWIAPHYSKTGGSTVTIKENCDVDEYTYTTATTKGTVDDSTHTVSMSFVNASTKGTVTLTNTYTPASVTPDNPKLTSIEKERLTEMPDGLNVSGVSLDELPYLKTGENSVTLLYAITVKGTKDASYDVTDDGAVYVGGAPKTGVLGADGVAVIYMTKAFSADEIAEGAVQNVAYVKAGDGTDPIPNITQDAVKGTPSDPVETQIFGRITGGKTRGTPQNGIVDYTVRVVNNTGLVLTGITVEDTMDTGLSILLDGESPAFDLKLYQKGSSVGESVNCRVVPDGQLTTWFIEDNIPLGAEIVLEYSARAENVPDESIKDLLNHLHVEIDYNYPTVYSAWNSNEWDTSFEDSCAVSVSEIIASLEENNLVNLQEGILETAE